ncbi:tight adherence protein C [Cupriavidus metallidurans]|jgi:tight adherence protein C|uniref:Bacterial type II secretion system protein, probably involved in Flp pilus synthesis n=1 Tax=Cupriavidus metallidurans (strain ATCC 43123 / DSM 2839 / NBRC 102507 / CH34) TaxID=266264 RepID=Q1LQQ1_CUPMC|nr:type II secretion system F family protein [Cupriavidus metallidurans]ABF07525.1 Bacterial type II secretion system protein, probably involved in Flp pilus synthesis [Cupriavidus metallidurans CH34]AVA32764.1 type II secretion system F family protein [Cupriavidus metallidurans]MDE4916933.1 type II secretion system F family protein [Cupriavidus metallidurans]QGS28156.1 type II secretion system F family protein [Cupriavidus metallidurans]UBM11623.1 type II secretion system F family protein [Cu
MQDIMQGFRADQLIVLALVFVAAFGTVLGVLYVFSPDRMRGRMEQIASETGTVPGNAGQQQAWVEKLVKWAQPVSRLSLPKEGWENSQLRVRFMNAGWRDASAAPLYFAAKTLLAVALPMIGLIATSSVPAFQEQSTTFAVLAVLAAIGYYIPNIVLSRKVTARQRTVFEEFPDVIDLLTVCVEAGLGLDAALMRVADELALRCPVLADELQLMLLELRSGFSKEKALSNLSLRTGVEDVDKFASMLIQADRFGTSLGESLRVLSDMLRTKRRMRAEEQAAKIALKLLFPLIFTIFPTLLLVLLGPAFIQIYRVLLPTMTGTN